MKIPKKLVEFETIVSSNVGHGKVGVLTSDGAKKLADSINALIDVVQAQQEQLELMQRWISETTGWINNAQALLGEQTIPPITISLDHKEETK